MLYISNPHNYVTKFKIEPLMMRNSQILSNNKKIVTIGSSPNDKFKREDVTSGSSFSSNQIFSFSQY